MLLSEREAHDRLEAAIARAGGVNALAREIGVSPPVVSNARRRATRRTPITGKVAEHLRLKRVSAYQLIENAKDPKQEHYEKERLEWNKTHGLPSEQSKTMRVAGKGVMGQRFPDQ
jgi:hypothetical protein